jgi:hypothetical protein
MRIQPKITGIITSTYTSPAEESNEEECTVDEEECTVGDFVGCNEVREADGGHNLTDG